MLEFGFIVDIGKKILLIGNEIWLSVRNLKTIKIKLITADDTQIPPNCETIVTIEIVTPDVQ